MPRRDDILRQMEQEEAANAQAGPWDKIKSRIRKGEVIPIVSNSLRIEQIFREDSETSDGNDLSQYEQLTEDWARLIKYPMADKRDLARVAQYYLVNSQKDNQNESQARTQYFEFLKKYLLRIAQTEPENANRARSLLAQAEAMHFSDVAVQLDYPRFADIADDPLHLLAQLPLPIFITTSQSDFLERALTFVGKHPKTDICFWSGEIKTKPEHAPDPKFSPTVEQPLVYHLFGLEDYPQTLVLSEDDYINFLITVVENKNASNPLIPTTVRQGLGQSQLILLGYHLQDWDFRVLFRFIQNYERFDRGMVVQLKPGEKENWASLESYLENYFNFRKFDIDWNNPDNFIRELWRHTSEQGQS